MDPDLLSSFEALFKSFKEYEKIDKIIDASNTLRNKEGNCLDFLLGSYFGASMYLYESFASNDGKDESEFMEMVKNHIEDLSVIFRQTLETSNQER